MSLLLTRHVDEYCVNIGQRRRGALGIYRLRAAPPPAIRANEVAVKTITPTTGTRFTRGLTAAGTALLVVDDDEAVRELVQDSLGNNDFRVTD